MDSIAAQSPNETAAWLQPRLRQFEMDWRAGRRPRIEDILALVPDGLSSGARPAVLRELLAVELALRREAGDLPGYQEYQWRFPELGSVIDEFRSALAADPGATAPYHDTMPLGKQSSAGGAVTTAARYRDLHFFRRGGLGELFRAQDESLHRETIIKFINEQCQEDASLLAQFKVEAEVTSRLDHPGIVPVYGIGEDWSGRPFYVMRLIHGRELKEAIQDYHQDGGPAGGGRKNRDALFALLEHLISACNTIAYVHHVGILHCDIKPSNIMIGKYGETFVLDWGLATNFERTATFYMSNEPTMRPHSAATGSTSGQRGGTLGYISPEQLLTDGPIGPTSDVYSLGATLYEIATGQAPFSGRDPDVRDKIRTGQFPRPRSLRPGISPRLEAICLKAMHLQPGARYATAQLLAADLTNWMRDEEVEAAPDRWYHRLARFARRHGGITAAVFVTLLTMVVAAGLIYGIRQQMKYQERLGVAENKGLAAALDTFEKQCGPFANGELNNLSVFRPFVDSITTFASDYLKQFEGDHSMDEHTRRVYELRATALAYYGGSTKDAIADLERAEALYKLPVSAGQKSGTDKRLAQIHLAKGRLLIQDRNFEEAIPLLKSTRKALSAMLEEGENLELQRCLAETNHCLGEAFLNRRTNRGDLKSAENYFYESKSVREDLATSRDGQSPDHKRILARSWGWLGDVYLAQGEITMAENAYQKSEERRRELYNSNPLDPEHRFQYARGLGNFGFLERGYRGDLQNAVKHLTHAEQIQEGLVREFPDHMPFKTELGRTHGMLAEIYLLAGDEIKCHAAAEHALLVYAALDGAQNANAKLGTAEVKVIAALDHAIDDAESKKLAQEAEELLKSLDSKSLSPSDLVTQAMALSLSGQPKAALDALKQAVERGENTAYRFEQHKKLAFKAIADDPALGPELEQLIKQLQTR